MLNVSSNWWVALKHGVYVKWYSIKEHTPIEGNIYLVNTSWNYGYGYIVSKFEKGAWWYIEDSCAFTADDVTHFCVIKPVENDD